VPDPTIKPEALDSLGLYGWNEAKQTWEHADRGLRRDEVYRELGAADAGLLTLLDVEELDAEAVALAPALVHAEEHLRPVLAVDAASAGVDRHERGRLVVRPGEHALEFEGSDPLVEVLERLPGVAEGALVALVAGELVEHLRVVERALRAVQLIDDLLEGRLLAEHRLRLVTVVPEARVASLGVELLELLALHFVVKDASAARRGGPRAARGAR